MRTKKEIDKKISVVLEGVAKVDKNKDFDHWLNLAKTYHNRENYEGVKQCKSILGINKETNLWEVYSIYNAGKVEALRWVKEKGDLAGTSE